MNSEMANSSFPHGCLIRPLGVDWHRNDTRSRGRCKHVDHHCSALCFVPTCLTHSNVTETISLSIRNLSFNDLLEWEVAPENELQSLDYLDVTGNEHWSPSKNLLQLLRNIATIQGVQWNKYCEGCWLIKPVANATSNVNSNNEYCWRLRSPSGWGWYHQIQYGKALEFIKAGFWPTCLCDDVCLAHEWELPLARVQTDVHRKGILALYVTGSVALLVNATIVFIILFRKSLRSDLVVLLILNVAVCDVLIGLFSVLDATFTLPNMYIEFLSDKLAGSRYELERKVKNIRNIMGPILTCAVASQVFGSFILTLEKFLKIVFVMSPDIRIGRKVITISLFFSWSLSLTFAVLPVFGVGGMTYTNYLGGMPLPTDKFEDGANKTPLGFAFGSQLVLLIIQLASFSLYLPIFIVVKRSSASLGIKREVTIAKKIALLVFTNLVFFTIPLVAGFYRDNLWSILGEKGVANWQDYSLTGNQWSAFVNCVIPGFMVSINSVLNPFLFTLRHPKVTQELHTISSQYNDSFVTFRRHLLRSNSNRVYQDNSMEMEDRNRSSAR